MRPIFSIVQITAMDEMVAAEEAVVTGADGRGKKNTRFSAGHDVLLLREVVAQSPYTAAAGEVTRTWAAIATALNAAQAAFNIDGRRCRDRTTLLLDYFRKEDFASLRRFALEPDMLSALRPGLTAGVVHSRLQSLRLAFITFTLMCLRCWSWSGCRNFLPRVFDNIMVLITSLLKTHSSFCMSYTIFSLTVFHAHGVKGIGPPTACVGLIASKIFSDVLFVKLKQLSVFFFIVNISVSNISVNIVTLTQVYIILY